MGPKRWKSIRQYLLGGIPKSEIPRVFCSESTPPESAALENAAPKSAAAGSFVPVIPSSGNVVPGNTVLLYP